MNVLAIGAHPDDVELGCGATLIRHIARGDHVTVLVMTGEERSDGGALGALLCCGGFRAGTVQSGAEAITVIEDAIRRTEASLVYTHAPDDTDRDHRST
jgi:LmbE family N-acetylglucosaminyl deacetylase